MVQNYVDVLKKYVEFNGRADAKEFWLFVLANILINIVLGILVAITKSNLIVAVIPSLYSLAILLPSLAVAVRRLHDTNKSGWFLLLGLIPIVNIVLLVFLCLGSDGDNQYGPA